MRIDPKHLRLLLAVGRTGSITAAAEELGISQPGVSSALRQLEYAVGCQLFNRGRNGAVPTEAGAILLRRAQAVEAIVRQAQEELAGHQRAFSGPVTIAGTPGALQSLLPDLVCELERQDDHIELRILEAPDSVLDDMLRDYRADLVLSAVGATVSPSDIINRTVGEHSFGLIVAADHALKKSAIRLKEVVNLPWILPASTTAFRKFIDALFMHHTVHLPEHLMISDSPATTKEIIRRTGFLTIMPLSVVQTELTYGILRSIRLEEISGSRALVVRYLQEAHLSPAAQRVLALLTRSHAVGDD